MTIYTKLEDNLTKLKLTAIKEYLPSYLEGNDLSLPEILEQLTVKNSLIELKGQLKCQFM